MRPCGAHGQPRPVLSRQSRCPYPTSDARAHRPTPSQSYAERRPSSAPLCEAIRTPPPSRRCPPLSQACPEFAEASRQYACPPCPHRPPSRLAGRTQSGRTREACRLSGAGPCGWSRRPPAPRRSPRRSASAAAVGSPSSFRAPADRRLPAPSSSIAPQHSPPPRAAARRPRGRSTLAGRRSTRACRRSTGARGRADLCR